MIYIIACLSSFLSGLGIGGGAVFMILSLLFNLGSLDESRMYNLLSFISLGVIIEIRNFKSEKIDKKKYLKTIIFIFLGCGIGIILLKFLKEEQIKKYFNIFLLIIGIYEIITSLINIKKGKNSNMKGES